MAAATRKADTKGRVLLFPDFANQVLVIERIGDDEVRLKKTKPRRRRKYTLQQLLEGVTPENIHAEVDFGRPVGKEVW
jgi:antitoxin component of MazEF toxin-antitoxin module